MDQDVAVVGCSAAGITAANVLARKGLKVGVFDAAERLEPEARTLIVTSKLRELPFPLDRSAIVNKIVGFEIHADGRMATIPFHKPDLVIDRTRLIRKLAEHAERNGVRFHFGRRFLDCRGNGKELEFSVSAGKKEGSREIRTRVLVGADGASSRVARSAGWPAQRLAYLTQAVVGLPEGVPWNMTRIWFIPEDTRYFYWLIPESKERGVVGLIGEDRESSRRALEGFLEKKGFDPVNFQEAWVPVYKGWIPVHRRVGVGHVFLVGDAAGHVKVSTVGGVVTGLQGALGVAEAILNNGESRRLRALRLELKLHQLVRFLLHRFAQEDYVRLLGHLNPQVRGILGAMPRDEALSLLFGLFCRRPDLLIFVLKVLMRRGR